MRMLGFVDVIAVITESEGGITHMVEEIYALKNTHGNKSTEN